MDNPKIKRASTGSTTRGTLMTIRMDTQGLPIPPTRRTSAPTHPSDVLTEHGRYLADVKTKHFPAVQKSSHLPRTTDDPMLKDRRRVHPTIPFLVGAVIVTALYFVGVLVAIPIGTHLFRQWHYGDSRVSMLEAKVGHQDEEKPTVLLATAYRGRIQVIEFAGGDPQQVRVYALTQVDLSENPAVSLKTEDVNQDGKLDLIVTVQAHHEIPFILFNNGKSFQPDVPKQKGESDAG